MHEVVLGVGHVGVGVVGVEIAQGLGAAVHLGILQAAHQDVGRSLGIARLVGDHPALGLVIILEEERRDRAEDEMLGAQGAEVRVEPAEGKPHHDLARRGGLDLGKEGGGAEVGLRPGPVERHKLRPPAQRLHIPRKRLEMTHGLGHGRDDRQGGHGRDSIPPLRRVNSAA